MPEAWGKGAVFFLLSTSTANLHQKQSHLDSPFVMSLRVWNIINPPADPHHKEVGSLREAFDYINREAARQLRLKWVICNAFGLEVWNEDDQEWEEWVDEDYNDLDEHARLQGWQTEL